MGLNKTEKLANFELDLNLRRWLPCILCGQLTKNRGVWHVGPGAREVAPPPGRGRMIVYPLCDNHVLDSYTFSVVEELVIAELKNYASDP